MRGDLRREEGVARFSGEQGEDIEHEQLCREALGGGDSALAAGFGGEGDGGFVRHGRGGDVGDGDGLVTGGVSLAERGEGVSGLTGLRDDEDGGILQRFFGAVAVLAGVFDIDGDPAEIFNEQLRNHAGVAAGATGGDDDVALERGEPGTNGTAGIVAEGTIGDVTMQRLGQRGWLLVDLAEHPVRVGAGGRLNRICHEGSSSNLIVSV